MSGKARTLQARPFVAALPSRVRMFRLSEAQRMTWLRIFLRLVSIGSLAAFISWIALILLDAPILAPGGILAPELRFQPYNADYESMLAAINIVWAVMLWRASDNPAKHSLFIDFTIWANVAHGLVMLIATPVQKGLVMTFIEVLPLFVVAAVLWWLRPKTSSPTAPAVHKRQRDESVPTGRVVNVWESEPHRREIALKTNEGLADRVIRVILGLGLLSLLMVGPVPGWGLIGLIGLMPLATGLVGFCPTYVPLGIDTTRWPVRHRKPQAR